MRQVRFFKFGCWAAAITAAVHLVGFVSGGLQASNETEQALLDTARNYQFPLPGGTRRSLWTPNNSGLSGTRSGLGFLIARRGVQDPILMTAATRALAAFSLVLFVISLWYWFLIPTLFIAAMALGFVLAAVSGRT